MRVRIRFCTACAGLSNCLVWLGRLICLVYPVLSGSLHPVCWPVQLRRCVAASASGLRLHRCCVNVGRRRQRLRRWAGLRRVCVCFCGGCIGVEAVWFGICGVWYVWTVSLVDWFVGCIGVEICVDCVVGGLVCWMLDWRGDVCKPVAGLVEVCCVWLVHKFSIKKFWKRVWEGYGNKFVGA